MQKELPELIKHLYLDSSLVHMYTNLRKELYQTPDAYCVSSVSLHKSTRESVEMENVRCYRERSHFLLTLISISWNQENTEQA